MAPAPREARKAGKSGMAISVAMSVNRATRPRARTLRVSQGGILDFKPLAAMSNSVPDVERQGKQGDGKGQGDHGLIHLLGIQFSAGEVLRKQVNVGALRTSFPQGL